MNSNDDRDMTHSVPTLASITSSSIVDSSTFRGPSDGGVRGTLSAPGNNSSGGETLRANQQPPFSNNDHVTSNSIRHRHQHHENNLTNPPNGNSGNSSPFSRRILLGRLRSNSQSASPAHNSPSTAATNGRHPSFPQLSPTQRVRPRSRSGGSSTSNNINGNVPDLHSTSEASTGAENDQTKSSSSGQPKGTNDAPSSNTAAAEKVASLQAQIEKEDSMVYLDGPQVYTCGQCRTHLTSHDDIISKSFHGRHGRAYLFDQCVNITPGPAEDRLLITGMHSVCDIFCNRCKSMVGWTYAKAYESSQKYKEGKFIIEKINLHLEETMYGIGHPAGERGDKWRIRSMSWGSGVGCSRSCDVYDNQSDDIVYEYSAVPSGRRERSVSFGGALRGSTGAVGRNQYQQQEDDVMATSPPGSPSPSRTFVSGSPSSFRSAQF